MIRIMIADDHAIIRDRIKQILRDEQDMEITCEALTGKDALECAVKNSLDLVLLDFYLPDMNALQIIPRLRKLKKDLPVLILSSLSEELYIRKSMEAGASGFVPKDNACDMLVPAIRRTVRKN
jgi:two-component system, NarL family, invasion response regulator UvrY